MADRKRKQQKTGKKSPKQVARPKTKGRNLTQNPKKQVATHPKPFKHLVQAIGNTRETQPASRQGSQPGIALLSVKASASLLGISVQAVRDNAAAGKYPGAHKITGPGGEGWAIPLDTLPALAQAMYYHQQFTAAGLTADLFPGGSTFSPEDREDHWKR